MERGVIRVMDFTTYNGTGYTSIPSTVQTHMKGIIESNKGQALWWVSLCESVLKSRFGRTTEKSPWRLW
jgi:hypothetical protein